MALDHHLRRTTYKLILIGDMAVGKTCLMNRFRHNLASSSSSSPGGDGAPFEPSCTSTIGVEFATYNCDIDGVPVHLEIWDTAGQERFRALTRAYYHNADGIIVVYDVTNRESFEHVQTWLADIFSSSRPDIEIVLIATKIDLVGQRKVSLEEGKQLGINLCRPHLEASAVSGENVHEVFMGISRRLVAAKAKNEEEIAARVELGRQKQEVAEKRASSSCPGCS